jgi:translation initiation factor 4G
LTWDAQALKTTPEEEREAAERKVKLRTLGNIRLIAELYKQDVVSEKILHACIQDMLGDGKSEPIEDNVEVLAWRHHLSACRPSESNGAFEIPCLSGSPLTRDTAVQAMCGMLTIVGKKLEETTKDKKRLEGYFVILVKWSKSKVLVAQLHSKANPV